MIEGPHPSSLPGSSKPQDEAKTSKSVAAVAYPLLARTQSTPLDPSRVQKKEPFISAWTFEDQGDFFVCSQHLDEEKTLKLNIKQFPVVQMNFTSVRKLINEKGFKVMFFLKSLGISIDDATQTLLFPKKENLRKNLDTYSEKNPSFPELSLSEVTDILPTDDFLHLMLTTDIILSDPPDLIHDICFHVIPILRRVFEFREGYRPYKEQIASTFSELQDEFDRSSKHFDEFISPVNQILAKKQKQQITRAEWDLMQDILRFSMSACLDIISTFDETFEQDKELKKLLFKTQASVLMDQDRPMGWDLIWNKEFPKTGIDHTTRCRIASSDRSKHFLFALYAQPFFKEVGSLKDALMRQLAQAKQDPTPFLASLDPELKKTIPGDVWNQIQAPLEAAMKGAFEDLSLNFFDSIQSIPINEDDPEIPLPYLFISHQEILEKAIPSLYRSLPHSLNLDFGLFKEVIHTLQKKPS
ncbi:MAG: hypothetical protein FJZ62_06290 [Chlamydiae bacterium]|nr:hypothetical protein [Chlamydiota bacterium]